jgi:hypothetical protein
MNTRRIVLLLRVMVVQLETVVQPETVRRLETVVQPETVRRLVRRLETAPQLGPKLHPSVLPAVLKEYRCGANALLPTTATRIARGRTSKCTRTHARR